MKTSHEREAIINGDSVTSVSRSILVSIRRIIRTVALHSRRLMEEHDLTTVQLAALHELALQGPVSARELAQRVEVSQPTMTGVLDRLEQRQLITRVRSSKDRRALVISATDQGRELLASAPPLLQQQFLANLARLQLWEQTMILATLQRVAAMMDASDLAAAPVLDPGPEQL